MTGLETAALTVAIALLASLVTLVSILMQANSVRDLTGGVFRRYLLLFACIRRLTSASRQLSCRQSNHLGQGCDL